MSKRQGYYNAISELYKDIYGSRPSMNYYQLMSDEELEKEVNDLNDQLVAQIADEKAHEEVLWHAFKARVEKLADELGGHTYGTAVKWLIDAEDCNGDIGFFCYLNGLDDSRRHQIMKWIDPE